MADCGEGHSPAISDSHTLWQLCVVRPKQVIIDEDPRQGELDGHNHLDLGPAICNFNHFISLETLQFFPQERDYSLENSLS